MRGVLRPQSEQHLGAAVQYAHDMPAMGRAVKGNGQREHVCMQAPHRVEPASVGQAIGGQRDQDAGDDDRQTNARPRAEQLRRLPP